MRMQSRQWAVTGRCCGIADRAYVACSFRTSGATLAPRWRSAIEAPRCGADVPRSGDDRRVGERRSACQRGRAWLDDGICAARAAHRLPRQERGPVSNTTSALRLTFACGLYDRMVPLHAGDVRPEGIDLEFLAIDDP